MLNLNRIANEQPNFHEHRDYHGKWAQENREDLALVLKRVQNLEQLTPDLIDILGRPNFTCIKLAELLRADGQVIKNKAEHEQATVLFWMLKFYINNPEGWKDDIDKEINRMVAKLHAKVTPA